MNPNFQLRAILPDGTWKTFDIADNVTFNDMTSSTTVYTSSTDWCTLPTSTVTHTNLSFDGSPVTFENVYNLYNIYRDNQNTIKR